jgi:hypothetical protein
MCAEIAVQEVLGILALAAIWLRYQAACDLVLRLRARTGIAFGPPLVAASGGHAVAT